MTLPASRILPAAGFAAVAALTALATIALGTTLGGGHGGAVAPVGGPPLRAYVGLPEREVFFGDEVEARLEVVVDEARVPSGAVSVRAAFRPYRVARSTRTSEDLGDGWRRIVYRYHLRCLGRRCVPPPAFHRVYRFPDTRVAAGRRVVRAAWPPLVVVSRVYGQPALRTDALRAVPAREPADGGLPWGLWLAGGLAVPGSLLLGGWALRRRRIGPADPVSETGAPAPHPLMSACDRVRERLVADALGRQRGALEHLARVLEQAGESRLAREVRDLAWRPQAPQREEVIALLRLVDVRAAASESEEEAA